VIVLADIGKICNFAILTSNVPNAEPLCPTIPITATIVDAI